MTAQNIIDYLNKLTSFDKEQELSIFVSNENGTFNYKKIKDLFISAENILVITNE
jgi:hypothetical protein